MSSYMISHGDNNYRHRTRRKQERIVECRYETSIGRQKFEDLVVVICNLKLPWRRYIVNMLHDSPAAVT
jgi:hypothetical protein